MKSQQLLDYIIKPTLRYMGGNYDSKNARMLLLATAAIESKCGYWVKQVDGPALGIWQMETETHDDIWRECDAIRDGVFFYKLKGLVPLPRSGQMPEYYDLIKIPMYACAMARLKFSMDIEPLPAHDDQYAIYEYYKRIYNTHKGVSTFEKFKGAWESCDLDRVEL